MRAAPQHVIQGPLQAGARALLEPHTVREGPVPVCSEGLLQAVMPLSSENTVVVARAPVHRGQGFVHPDAGAGPALGRDALPDVACHCRNPLDTMASL